MNLLLVSGDGPERDELRGGLTQLGASVVTVADSESALSRLGRGGPDVVVVDDALGETAWNTLASLSRINVGRVFMLRGNDAQRAARATRLGVHDIVPCEGRPNASLVLRAAAFARSAGDRARTRARSRAHLRRSVEALREGHTQLLRQVGELASGVGGTCRTLSEQMERVALGAEFNALIRQELELEGLLRTTLEYVLKKAGSTNAAIFLPGTGGDYTLGAYINFDLPKDSAEIMLGRLADDLAPACEAHRELTLVVNPGQLSMERIDEEHWLSGSTLAVRACWSDEECIAVLAVFRDRRHPFAESVKPALSVITELFGAQLARVIKTHYRGKPKEEWGSDAAAA